MYVYPLLYSLFIHTTHWQVTYFQQLREQFSIAFDVYLNILRCVRLHIDQSLDRDHENWPMSGACPCCTFEVSLNSVYISDIVTDSIM
jgi:hypothetical protein